MEFCPNCGTLLQFEAAQPNHKARFKCPRPRCRYIYPIDKKIVHVVNLGKKKEVEPIFTEDDRQKMFNKSDCVNCPKCHETGVYFYEMQCRSADEPSSIFYMCCNQSCKAQWRED